VTPIAIVAGIPVDATTMSTAIDRIGVLVERGRRERTTHQVATVNVDFVVNAIEQPDVRRILQSSDLNLADGMPIVWASRWLGARLPERVAGADLVPALARASAERGWRVHLWGGTDDTAEHAARLLRQRHPGAQITGAPAPTIDDVADVDDTVIEGIANHRTDVLCVALGNPKQERFIHAHRDRLGCPVQIGVGGTLDLIVGAKRRAPAWAQRVGAEWLFRWFQEPGRLGRRYAHDVRVLGPQLFDDLCRAVRLRHQTPVVVEPSAKGWRVTLSATANEASVLRIGPGDVVRIDFGSHTSLAPATHADLVAVLRSATLADATIRLEAANSSMIQTLRDYGTWEWIRGLDTAIEHTGPAGFDGAI
jgi:N-acetylglucosaminyldiphosphoundecaprenol N-acetyl-beta-D-mannosaminyltransferase